MDSEKMKNITPGSLEELQFILTLKQEEGVSQNELRCPCLKGSPQRAWYIREHKAYHKQVLGAGRLHHCCFLGLVSSLLGETEIGCCVFIAM